MTLKHLFASLLCSALLIPSLLAAAPRTFQAPVTLEAGTSPRGLGVGDVYGDGTQALVVANFGSPTFIGQSTPASFLNSQNSNLQVFLPSASGLRLTSTIPTASSPRGLAFLKLTGKQQDGILATSYDAGLVQVFEWQSGKFVKSDEAPTLKMPVGVASGTTRSGGTVFVAVCDYGANSLSLYPVKNGKLGNRVDISVPAGPTQVAIGDLNGDGFNEIAVACLEANKIEILSVPSDDISAYTHSQTLTLPDGSSPSDLKLADLNGDGKTDMVVADFSTNAISLFFQTVGGPLAAPLNLTTSGLHPNGLTVGDLDNDGVPEIIVANRDSDSLDVFERAGSQFQLEQTLKLSSDATASFGPVEVAVLNGIKKGEKTIVTTHMRSNSVRTLTLNEVQAGSTVLGDAHSGGGLVFNEDSTFCYPNPGRDGETKFHFDLPAPSAVELMVFDLTGTVVWSQSLSPSQTQAGPNLLDWNLSNPAGQALASGIYIVRVTTGDQSVTRKLAVIH